MMKQLNGFILFSLVFLCFATTLNAQALDDIVERTIMEERRVLPYAPLREADIFWEKRVWRVIDVREKMNLPFMYPEAPFFEILTQAADEGRITLYSAENDKFTYSLEDNEYMLAGQDTIPILDPETGEVTYTVVNNKIYYEDIKRFRIKEVWFFDENTSTMNVRILGIAPLKEEFDEHGNFKFEKPLFWIYFPELREELARHEVFNTGNDASPISWADLFEMRYFASVIYKASNIHDNRLKDVYSGVDRLLEADKIKSEIFNFEHDLWEY